MNIRSVNCLVRLRIELHICFISIFRGDSYIAALLLPQHVIVGCINWTFDSISGLYFPLEVHINFVAGVIAENKARVLQFHDSRVHKSRGEAPFNNNLFNAENNHGKIIINNTSIEHKTFLKKAAL